MKIEIIDDSSLGYGFIENEYLKPNEDENKFRYLQNKSNLKYRNLTKQEILILESRLNTSDNWSDVLVTEEFDPFLISSCSFYGLVRIGNLKKSLLKFNDLILEQGITNSRIISCDIGSYCAIHDVKYLSHYIVEPYSILHRIGEMQTTNHSKFGVGILKQGEDPKVRISIDVRNENTGRCVFPFEAMTVADAYLRSNNKENTALCDKLDKFTYDTISTERGFYGIVGTQSVIKQCSIIKDVNFGPASYVKGANKLKNLTISSREDEPTQIGEGVELVNGIIGSGCHIFYGVKAIRFIMQDRSNLKYGARLVNSILGENSTVSCCEVLNSLIYPGHEQHHNNSFLIAAMIQGQSNSAAGSNIGSNHNSRSSDGELIAKRGFWPALSSTLKYNCCFASFCLITKGNYPNEINLKLPFALLTSDTYSDTRAVMPAYYWMYNMYALERNSWKVKSRDKRKRIRAYIESAYLAPDTIFEIVQGIKVIKHLAHKAYVKNYEKEPDFDLFTSDLKFDIYASGIEKKQKVKILKWRESLNAYYEMLYYYAVDTLIYSKYSFSELIKQECIIEEFENFGGQLLSKSDIATLINGITSSEINSWDDIHSYYADCYSKYDEVKAKTAIAVIKFILEKDEITSDDLLSVFSKAYEVRLKIESEIFNSRNKDYSKFNMMTFKSAEERDVVLGAVDDNSFIIESREKTKEFKSKLDNYIKTL